MLLLLVIGCSLTSLTIWKVWSSRERALAEVDVHGLNLTQALNTYTEGIVRQSSLLLLGLVERLETEGNGPAQIQRIPGSASSCINALYLPNHRGSSRINVFIDFLVEILKPAA